MQNTVKRPGTKRGRKRKYSDSYQRQVAYVVLHENLTLKEAGIRFGIAHQTISRFTTRYYNDIAQSNVIGTMATPTTSTPEPSPEPSLRQELMEYESKLRHAQLKITALETMIELAEDTYKIAIRKNSGTKQHE